MYVAVYWYGIGSFCSWSFFPEPRPSSLISDDIIGPVGEMGRFSDESSRWCFKIR